MFKKMIFITMILSILFQNCIYAVPYTKINARMTSDKAYIFRLKGSDKEFLLLDESEDSQSRFFVLALDYYGIKQYHSKGLHKFDPKDPLSVAFFLNNDFVTKGNKSTFPTLFEFKLPQQIINHIDFNHEWRCEAGGLNGDAPNPYKITCGIAVLSLEELIKYSDKIGWDDDFMTTKYDYICYPWFIRSVTDDGYLAAIRPNVSKTQISTYGRTTESLGIRPCFWLDEDFFRENEIELESMGDGVAKIFTKYYTKDEMLKYYTENQCYDYLGYTPDIKLTCSNGLLTLENNREREITGVVQTIMYGTGNRACGVSARKITLLPKEKMTIELAENADENVLYSQTRVIKTQFPFSGISNSVKIYSDGNVKK